MFSLTCLILSCIICFSYIFYIRIKYKPDCISQSYYILGNVFTVWLITTAFLIFPAWVEISPIYFQFLPFLSVISLSIVGLCPRYFDKDRIPHIAGACVTGVLSIIWNIVSGTLYVPLILLLIPLKDKLFWVECLAFLNIYSSIIIQLWQ